MKNFTLNEFNKLVRQVLKLNLEPSYWIVAEIGEMNLHSSGHCYLTLVEKKDQKILAKMRANIWSFTFNQLHQNFVSSTGTPLQTGMTVLLNASLEFHEQYGLSLNVKDIDPNYTLGEREKARQATIQKLINADLIDLNKSLSLPLVPQQIAVISSKMAAGFGDFQHQLSSNPYGYKPRISLFEATMQGDQAAESILLALKQINAKHQHFDLIAIVRGGGAKTDLDCFDSYELCEVMAMSKLPILTGLGHERDETIADLVAHTKLKTPTAVAEFITSTMLHFESEINLFYQNIQRASSQLIAEEGTRTLQYHEKIRQCSRLKILETTQEISKFEEVIEKKPKELLNQEKKSLALQQKIFLSFDPQKVLERGYSLTKVNGGFLDNRITISEGDRIETQYSTGRFVSTVDKTE